MGAGLPDPEGGQLRLERERGEPRFQSSARPAPTRSCRRPPSTATARPARSPAAGSTAATGCPSSWEPTSTATGPPAASGGSSTTAQKAIWHRELVDTPFNITGFGTDHAGELYVIDHAGGFYRLEPTTEADQPTQPFPTRLSETGLFASVADHKPHPAALRFDVSAPQWADGATMEHFAALPGLERVVQKPQLNAGGTWTLPNGSVLVQTLALARIDDAGKPARKRIETRLLVRQQGEWTGYSYRWNAEQTDAELVPAAGGSQEFEVPDAAEPGGRREQTWRFPSRTECLACHSRAAGFILAFTPLQLDRDVDYGGIVDNQLRCARAYRRLRRPAADERQGSARGWSTPTMTKAPREARVRSYLHVNCSICHVRKGAATRAWSCRSRRRSAKCG